MPVTLNSTGISFSDGNSQNTVASGGVSAMTETTYNSSSNFSVPGNSVGVAVYVKGGGGGGSPTGGPNNDPGGPGGMGGSSFGLAPTNVVTGTVPVTVGGGGNGLTWTNFGQRAPSGGSSSFGNFLSVNGGLGALPPANSNSQPGNLGQCTVMNIIGSNDAQGGTNSGGANPFAPGVGGFTGFGGNGGPAGRSSNAGQPGQVRVISFE